MPTEQMKNFGLLFIPMYVYLLGKNLIFSNLGDM